MIRIDEKCYSFLLDLNEELKLFMTFICVRINNIKISVSEVQYDPITSEYTSKCIYMGNEFIGKDTTLDGSLKMLSARIYKHNEIETKNNSE